MSFNDIPKIESMQFYLDLAHRHGEKATKLERSNSRGKRIDKSKNIELARILAIKRAIEKPFDRMIKDYPSLDDMTEFYKKLLKLQLNYVELKKSLGAVKWAVEQLNKLLVFYQKKIKRCQSMPDVNRYRREFYGRVASVLKQVKKNLIALEEARHILITFPVIKNRYTTVCIGGFPNVGKTTLLKKLTGSGAEVQSYAFTTKKLNTGYKNNVQFIDTPGTLDRVGTMNPIEQQAYLAMKYCADVIVYVFDVTEPYPLADQKKLLLRLKAFDVPILVYVSKHDLEAETVETFAGTKYIWDADSLLAAIEATT